MSGTSGTVSRQESTLSRFRLSVAEKISRSLRKLLDELGSKARIIAKIEDQTGLRNLEAIVRASDAIMIARGDLGIEIDYYVLPLVQAHIVEMCLAEGKPVIVRNAASGIDDIR